MKSIPSWLPLPSDYCQFTLPEMALKERVIVISGATGGLGTALSKQCAKAGATVVLVGRNLKKLEALYDVLDADGPAQPAIVPLNQETAVEHDYQQMSEMLTEEFGHLDALVHTAAALGTLTPLPAISQAEWSNTMAVNLTSARLLSIACLPLLKQRPGASITFTLDAKTSAYWGAYGVSKAGVAALVTMLADENDGRKGEAGEPLLAINGIDPGPMRTPLRRRAFPGELESESPWPEERLGPFLAAISRLDPQVCGACMGWPAA